jgi:hypothetical protein
MKSEGRYGMIRVTNNDLRTLKLVRAEAQVVIQQPIKNIDFMTAVVNKGIKALRKERYSSLANLYLMTPTYRTRKSVTDVQG